VTAAGRSGAPSAPAAGLVDIHAHLLPGIDDGPETLAESLAMARAAGDAGIEAVVATPHLRADFPDVHVEELAERCRALREALGREGIVLRVVSGAEVSMEWALEAPEEQLRLASYDQRGTDLLIETPENVSLLDRMLVPLTNRGYRVTLAHPERAPAFQRNPERLQDLVAQGALLQVNAASVMGRWRNERGRLALALCRDGLAHALASDGHRARDWRPITDLAAAVEKLSAAVGVERADWLASAAPRAICQGAALPPVPALSEQAGRRGWFGRG
jgi:protein-tyrosine phosphatase